MPLLDVENLTLQFDTDEGRVTAVEEFSLSTEASGDVSDHGLSGPLAGDSRQTGAA